MFAKLRQLMPFLPGGKPEPAAGQVLALRPLRNPAVRWERKGDDDLVVITYKPKPFEGRLRLVDKLFGLPSEKKIELTDELSSAVWEMCDGKYTVAEIASFLSQKYKLGRRQAEVSVLAFLKTLQTKRLVGVPVDQARELAEKQKPARRGEKAPARATRGSEGFYAEGNRRKSKAARQR